MPNYGSSAQPQKKPSRLAVQTKGKRTSTRPSFDAGLWPGCTEGLRTRPDLKRCERANLLEKAVEAEGFMVPARERPERAMKATISSFPLRAICTKGPPRAKQDETIYNKTLAQRPPAHRGSGWMEPPESIRVTL